jgi:hypothetical protein
MPAVIRSPRGTSMTVHGYLDEMWARAKEEAKAAVMQVLAVKSLLAQPA